MKNLINHSKFFRHLKYGFLFCNLFCFLAFNVNSQTNCQNFEDQAINNTHVNSIGNWVMYNSKGSVASSPSKIRIQNNAAIGSQIITASDAQGATYLINTADFSGNWIKNGSTCFCFDLKLISDGGNYNPALQVRHGIFIFRNLNTNIPLNHTINSTNSNPLIGFSFKLNSTYDENTPWQQICLPIQTIGTGDPLPSNSFGQWVPYGNAMGGLSQTDAWNNVIQNVTDVGFFVDATNDNQSEIIGLDNLCIQSCPKSYPIPICCPPMSGELLSDLFDIVPSGNVNAPFKLQFNSNPYFKSLFQAYLDYIVIIKPGIQKLVSNWRLIDAGTGQTPNNVSKIEETFSWFKPGQGGNIFGNPNFFSHPLEINHWYKIHTGIYTEPGPSVFEDCNKPLHFFYRVSIINGRLVGTVSNGNRVLKKTDLGNSRALKKDNTKSKIRTPHRRN